MLYAKLDQIMQHADSAADEIARGDAYSDGRSPYHADAVSMYNTLVTISIQAGDMLKKHYPDSAGAEEART